MPRAPQSRGRCAFCGHQTTKAAIGRHLDRCTQWEARSAEAEGSEREPETLHQLRIQDAYLSAFWLDVEVRGSTTMRRIDAYLRAIWLDCCGHLSEFSANGWGSERIGMSRKVDAAFSTHSELTHVYDFGTESVTRITETGQRLGVPLSAKPVVLLARNVLPGLPCVECDQQATHLCMECQYEHEMPGQFCPKHVDDHPHDSYGEPIEIVNSPRVGMCGEVGPAEPPY